MGSDDEEGPRRDRQRGGEGEGEDTPELVRTWQGLSHFLKQQCPGGWE
jgi:hypothetical protein